MPRRISQMSGIESDDCITTLANTYDKILNQINEIGKSSSRAQRRRSELEVVAIVKHAKTGSEDLNDFQRRFPDLEGVGQDPMDDLRKDLLGIDRRLRSRVVDPLKEAVVRRSEPLYTEVRDQLSKLVDDAKLAYSAFSDAVTAEGQRKKEVLLASDTGNQPRSPRLTPVNPNDSELDHERFFERKPPARAYHSRSQERIVVPGISDPRRDDMSSRHRPRIRTIHGLSITSLSLEQAKDMLRDTLHRLSDLESQAAALQSYIGSSERHMAYYIPRKEY